MEFKSTLSASHQTNYIKEIGASQFKQTLFCFLLSFPPSSWYVFIYYTNICFVWQFGIRSRNQFQRIWSVCLSCSALQWANVLWKSSLFRLRLFFYICFNVIEIFVNSIDLMSEPNWWHPKNVSYVFSAIWK